MAKSKKKAISETEFEKAYCQGHHVGDFEWKKHLRLKEEGRRRCYFKIGGTNYSVEDEDAPLPTKDRDDSPLR